MALSQKEIEIQIGELETRLERLRHLYDQYFLGFEKLAPEVPRKDVDRRIAELRRDQIRNTALRFRFQVITQKYQTYQSFWQRVCRQIEEGTFKRHLQRAKQRFGVNGKRGRLDFDLDIDVDLGELEAQVEDDLKSIDDGLTDEDRRILREVEAEMHGNNASPDTERPNAASSERAVATNTPPPKFASEDDDDDDDLPTNRPPTSVTAERLALTMPKNPVPSFSEPPERPERAGAPLTPGAIRPAIRKSIEAPARLTSAAPQIRRTNTVMPLIAPAPTKPSAQPGRESQGRIALPVPGAASRKPPENLPSPESASMRAAPDRSAIRSSPQEAQAQQTEQRVANSGLGVPGRASAHMRTGPVPNPNAPAPSKAPGAPGPTSKAPVTSARGPLTASKPPPPLPSAIATRGRAPSLSELADAAKKGEKDAKK